MLFSWWRNTSPYAKWNSRHNQHKSPQLQPNTEANSIHSTSSSLISPRWLQNYSLIYVSSINYCFSNLSYNSGYLILGNQNNCIGIARRYRLDDRRIGVWSPIRYFSLLRSFHTGCGTLPASLEVKQRNSSVPTSCFISLHPNFEYGGNKCYCNISD
jgi:hypothetical protein